MKEVEEYLEVEVHVPELTDEGRAWSEAHASSRLTARVALAGDEWPKVYRRMAVAIANDEARRERMPGRVEE